MYPFIRGVGLVLGVIVEKLITQHISRKRSFDRWWNVGTVHAYILGTSGQPDLTEEIYPRIDL